MRKLFCPIIPFVVLFAITLSFGCSQAQKKADVTIINGNEPESLDPAISTSVADNRIIHALFEGLCRLDPKTAKAIPALAETWDISPDGRTYTFHLRTNAFWSTGEPITTADVVYSWIRVLKPETASEYAGQLYYVKNCEAFNIGKLKDPAQLGFKAIDDHTLRVELVGPTPFFLDLCGFPTLAVVPRWWIEKYGDRWLLTKGVPTSGPYTLDSWRVRDRIRIRRNPRHWDQANIMNDTVDFLSMESEMTALNIYESGQADILWDKNLIPSLLMDVLKNRSDCQIFDYLGTFFYRYNVTKKPFDDARVRKALAMVVDKQRIVDRITKSGEKPASHFVPGGMPIYNSPQGLDYNPEEARKLLAEAGYPGGKGFPTIQYLFKTGRTDEQIGVELQAMWKKELGINVELRQAEWKVYLGALSSLDYEIARSSWIGDYNDPNTFLDMWLTANGNNRTGWKNMHYDDLVHEGNMQTDPKKREEILKKAETLLIHDDVPIVPIYFYAGVMFYRPEQIDGVYFNLLDEHPVYAIKRKAESRGSRVEGGKASEFRTSRDEDSRRSKINLAELQK